MSKIKIPIKNLTKKEFDEAYDAMVASYKDKDFNKYPLPNKEKIIHQLVQSGEITVSKALELKKTNQS